MDESISATDANRDFSRILRDVREGTSFVVTSHGRPIARIVPADAEAAEAKRVAAWETLLRRLESQTPSQSIPWTRDDLYD